MPFVLDLKLLVLISAIISFVLSWIVFQQGKKNKTNISFALFTFFIGLWAFCFYFYFHPVFFSQLVWIKLVYLISIFMIPPALYFILCFPMRRMKSLFPFVMLYTACSLPLIWLLFFTDHWVEEVIVYPWGPQTVTGSGYVFYFIFVGAVALFGFYNLTKNYLAARGILKAQLKFFLLGVFFFGVPTIIVDIVLPLVSGNSRYFWLSPVFALAVPGATTYAITRYRLMDVRIAIGKGLVYIFTLAALVALIFLSIFLSTKLPTPVSTNVVLVLAMIVGILLFQPIFRFYEKFAAKYFYYVFYSYQTVLTDLGKGLTRFLDLNQLSSLIVNTLMNTMKLDRTVVLLREPGDGEYRIQKNIGFREENGISLVKDNFLTIWLERTQKPLVYEELSLIVRDTTKEEEKERLGILQSNMKRIEAALCLPLFIEDKIIGMIVLGNKLSGDPYSEQDIELLTNLANQASVSFQNARLYSEIKGFSEKLEREVEKRTKELQEAYEDLKKLDKAKSEFISIASHQLRTPLTAVKGYISMMQEGTYGKMPEKMEKPLDNIYVSNERLIKLVNDLLNVSRIEAGRMEMKLEKVSLEEMIVSVIEELSNVAKEKDVYLKWEKSKETLPKISLDRDKIRQVVMNVIDNAIRYTEKGGVTIKAKESDGKIQILVSDTGVGLTKSELSKMFESFSRGAAGTRLYTEGVGLGLYVARRFVEVHDGKIWAESKGKGKGSIFYIELPII